MFTLMCLLNAFKWGAGFGLFGGGIMGVILNALGSGYSLESAVGVFTVGTLIIAFSFAKLESDIKQS